jgi:hypothetical protein
MILAALHASLHTDSGAEFMPQPRPKVSSAFRTKALLPGFVIWEVICRRLAWGSLPWWYLTIIFINSVAADVDEYFECSKMFATAIIMESIQDGGFKPASMKCRVARVSVSQHG